MLTFLVSVLLTVSPRSRTQRMAPSECHIAIGSRKLEVRKHVHTHLHIIHGTKCSCFSVLLNSFLSSQFFPILFIFLFHSFHSFHSLHSFHSVHAFHSFILSFFHSFMLFIPFTRFIFFHSFILSFFHFFILSIFYSSIFHSSILPSFHSFTLSFFYFVIFFIFSFFSFFGKTVEAGGSLDMGL